MPSFGKRSLENLSTCDVRLVTLAEEVVKVHDCSCIEGWRNEEDQNRYVEEGKSKVLWPFGKHNFIDLNGEPCSRALHLVPYPDLDWEDRERFMYFGGFVLGVAAGLSIPIRWGGDWDRDHNLKDQSFDDLCHFELVMV
jgi:peptidoglycan LD-endopeptidase CwlK